MRETQEQITYYTYEITASDSDKYYIGVSHVKIANASAEQCQQDSYYGSGGKNRSNKFRNWKRKHRNQLQKRVIATHRSKELAYAHEKELIGNKWREDPLCLNSRAGGGTSAPDYGEIMGTQRCPEHGITEHIGRSCRICVAETLESEESCPTHGMSSHYGGHCRKCVASENFHKDHCWLCHVRSSVHLDTCSEHGMTIFRGKNCAKCFSGRVFLEGKCSTHGVTTLVGGQCPRCYHGRAFYLDHCPTHGETKHKGGNCYRCQISRSYSKRTCPKHGDNSTFKGEKCMKCAREERES